MRRLTSLLVFAVWLPSIAAAQSSDWWVRSALGFAYEPEVVSGLWAEGYGGLTEADDLDRTLAGGQLVQGWKDVELGVNLPWLEQRGDLGSGRSRERGLGAMRFWGKWVPLQSQFGNLGGGLELAAPTGHDGELYLNPFLSGSLHYHLFQLRGRVAYLRPATGDAVFPDALNYGGGLFFTANPYFGGSFEIDATHVDASGPSTPVVAAPSLSFRFLFPEVDMIVRPTALIGLNDQASDWGFLGSIILTRSPDWVSRPR